MSKPLTDAALRALKKGRLTDASLPGFSARASRGYVYFSYRYKVDGRRKQVPLGRWPVVSLAEARAMARRLYGERLIGGDPIAESEERARAMTVAEMIRECHRVHWTQKCKPTTAQTAISVMERLAIPEFGDMKAASLTHADIMRWHSQIGETRKTGANRALGYLSKACSEAVRWGVLTSNPCAGIAKFKERRIDRYLHDHEIRRLSQTLDEMAAEGYHPDYLAVVRFLLFTGLRSSEALGLTWADVETDEAGRTVARLKDSKTGARTIVIPRSAMDVLEGLGRTSGHLFLSSRGKPIKDLWVPPYPWPTIRKRAGIPDVRVHDLRHTFATLQVRAGTPVPIIQKLLGHSKLATTSRYMHVSKEQEQDAAETVAAMIGSRSALPGVGTTLRIVPEEEP